MVGYGCRRCELRNQKICIKKGGSLFQAFSGLGHSVKKSVQKKNTEKRFLSPRFSPSFSLVVFRAVSQLTERHMEEAEMGAFKQVN